MPLGRSSCREPLLNRAGETMETSPYWHAYTPPESTHPLIIQLNIKEASRFGIWGTLSTIRLEMSHAGQQCGCQFMVYSRWKAYVVSSKFKEGRLVGKGVADWWVLGTQPLGMAPRKLLDDTEMMQIKRMGGNTNADRWHSGPAQETLLLSLCAACGFI